MKRWVSIYALVAMSALLAAAVNPSPDLAMFFIYFAGTGSLAGASFAIGRWSAGKK